MKLELSPPAPPAFGETLIQEADVRRIAGFHSFQPHQPVEKKCV